VAGKRGQINRMGSAGLRMKGEPGKRWEYTRQLPQIATLGERRQGQSVDRGQDRPRFERYYRRRERELHCAQLGECRQTLKKVLYG
jgi:hypothetical protein